MSPSQFGFLDWLGSLEFLKPRKLGTFRDSKHGIFIFIFRLIVIFVFTFISNFSILTFISLYNHIHRIVLMVFEHAVILMLKPYSIENKSNATINVEVFTNLPNEPKFGESGEDVNESRKQEEIVIDRGEVLEENIGTLGEKSESCDFQNRWMFPKIVGFPPKSSILFWCSVINHPFWGTPIFGNTQVDSKTPCLSLKIQQLQNHVGKGTRSCFIIDTS